MAKKAFGKYGFDWNKQLKKAAWEFLLLFLAIFIFLHVYDANIKSLGYKYFVGRGVNRHLSMQLFGKLLLCGTILSLALVLIFDILIPFLVSRTSMSRGLLIYIPTGILILLGFTLKILFYVKKHIFELERGFYYFANVLCRYINKYFDTSYHFSNADIKYQGALFFIFLMGFIVLAYLLGKLITKQVVIVLLPLAPIVFLMIVGLTPGFFDLILFAVFVFLVYSRRHNYVGILMFAGVVVLGGLLFTGVSKSIASRGQEFRHFQERFIENLANKFSGDNTDPDFEKIDGKKPSYSGDELLRIETYIHPKTSLYLKGFIGNNFKNDKWTYDEDAFDDFCAEMDWDEDEVMNADIQFYRDYTKSVEGIDTFITYIDKNGKRAYVPYFSRFSAKDVEYQYDFVVNALNKNDTLEFKSSLENVFQSTAIDRYYYEFSNKYSHAEKYTKFVNKQYTKSSGNGRIKNVAKVLANAITSESKSSNEYKFEACNAVESYFTDSFTYNLNVKKGPSGKSYIEYFMDTKEGYCMHFATLATLLLREMGVPARYASGYIAPAGGFTKNDNDLYSYTVTDYCSHAWVEVYFENVGWVPIEVTPGYNESNRSDYKNLPTKPNKSPTPTANPSKAPKPSKAPTKPLTVSPKPTKAPSISAGASPSAAPTKAPIITQGYQGHNGNGSGSSSTADDGYFKDVIITVVKVILILAVLALIIWILYRRYNASYIFIGRHFNVKKYTEIVLYLNKKIYKRARFRDKSASLGDLEFTKIMNAKYNHLVVHSLRKEKLWAEYLRIVRFATYSGQESTKEDAEFVIDVYKAIRK